MAELCVEQIRYFRLVSHHLDRRYEKSNITKLAGACGMQNTPPGAWETALYNRTLDISLSEMEDVLYNKRILLQAWSMRGAPFVFPTEDSAVFLSALAAKEDEPFIYTRGISLALDFLQMTFEELYEIFKQVMPMLDNHMVVSKCALDQTIAQWMTPFLPAGRQELWSQPSMYGSPDRQTVGGAVVSFMLRPASFCGLAVFGERKGMTPAFTSYKNWTGHSLVAGEEAAKELVRRYLHCYGPSTADRFTDWLGCSRQQGKRMWTGISEEIEPVIVFGKKAYILTEDKERLFSPHGLEREILFLGGHDPYLDQRDRMILEPDKSRHKSIWKMVTNPGVILYQGEIAGIWTSKKKKSEMEIQATLWNSEVKKEKIHNLAEEYAAFRRQRLSKVNIITEL